MPAYTRPIVSTPGYTREVVYTKPDGPVTGRSVEVANVSDHGTALSYLRRVEENYNNLRYQPFFDDQLNKISELHQQYFVTQTGPTGDPWEPWHWRPFWAASDHPTLVITGRLKQSLVRGGQGNIAAVTDTTLEFGTSVGYAGVLNDGGQAVITEPLIERAGKRQLTAGTTINLPAREHVGLSDSFLDDLMEDLGDYVVKGVLP